MARSEFVKAGAVWIGETKKGGDMLSIAVRVDDQEYSFVAFTNDFKKEKKHPDFIVYANKDQEPKPVQTQEKKYDSAAPQRSSGGSRFKKRSAF